MQYGTIRDTELDRCVERPDQYLIIDLRNVSSYRNCHIKGAQNFPYQEMDSWQDSLTLDKVLVFYCSRGSQSMLACNRLSAMGYQVLNVANGITFYRGKYLVR